jgi:alkylhydroperoxidase/carboxymuconolactone decarboxylase family protein YurZ
MSMSENQYLSLFNKVASEISAPLAHITACAVHTCVGNWRALGWQIRAAYAAGTEEIMLAEALSLAMFPGSIPHYVRAADVWRQLILSKDVEASEPFQQWASLSGQGGFDEASQVKQR